MSTEYRLLTLDDYEQAAVVEARAFYNKVSAGRAEQMKEIFPPEWTVGAFIDGNMIGDVRAIPQARLMGGTAMRFGAVGPVTCAAPYRRQGHVKKMLKIALEYMHERGQVLSGLYTPHDALYQRSGWERGEFKKHVKFAPKSVRMRHRGAKGSMVAVSADEWPRLDAVYGETTRGKNGPFVRREVWWREAIFKHWDGGELVPSDAVVWIDAEGRDQGYAVYWEQTTGRDGNWNRQAIWVDQFEALTPDAYLGLWEHLLTHDLADAIISDRHPDDPVRQIFDPPQEVETLYSGGAMIRVVDVENAITQRPYAGEGTAAVTLHVKDHTLDFNDGTWRIEAGEGRMHAERTEATPDAECSVNTLASLFTGYLTPEWAAISGFLHITRPDALDELTRLFAVSDPPYSPDHY